MSCLYRKIGLVVSLLILVVISDNGCCMAELRVVIFDVGMGQSVLLENDGHGLLIDTGIAEKAPHVLTRMKAYGLKSLDYLVLSHLHRDHAAGYPQIRDVWRNTPVLGNCHDLEIAYSTEHEMCRTLNGALKIDPLYACLAAGDVLHWQGYRLDVLWPDTLLDKTDLNAASLVLLLTTPKEKTVLVMGDVDQSVEARLLPLLSSIFVQKSVDLYVAGHHAAADSTNPDLLKLLTPNFSVVSVGKGNSYGYPAAESMAILEQYSQTVLRTDIIGEICFVMKEKGFVSCENVP